MNYHRIYINIIINRKNNAINGYTETHHIIPRCLNGSNYKQNLVDLTAREHFICHLLLTKMYPEGSIPWIKMCKAFMNMFRQGNHKRYCPSKWYEYCRIQVANANSINQTGKGNSQYGKHWIINPNTGETKSLKPEFIQEYLDNGWILGRSLKNKLSYIQDKTMDKMNIDEQEKKKLKQENKQKRQKLHAQRKQKHVRTYMVTNQITNEKKFVTEEQLKHLEKEWVSLHYLVDKNKVKELFTKGYKIQQIADYFNMSYHNFYSWYKPYRKQIQEELKSVFKKQKMCPICGKIIPTTRNRKYCSKQCWIEASSQRIWVKKENDIKHILKNEYNKYENQGWIKVTPIIGKSSDQWF